MKKFYYELQIATNINKEILTDFVMEFVEAVEDAGDLIIVRSEDDLENLQYALNEFATSLKEITHQDITITTHLEKKENIDWIENYKNSIQPVEAGDFYIHPTWAKPKEGFINIQIDPSLAFGSGHHESTNSVLQFISKYVEPNKRVIDVGCGSGILGIACAKKGAIVDYCDTDEESIKNTNDNLVLNKQSANNIWLGSANRAKGQYNVVIANIVADVLVMLYKDLTQILANDGILIISGIIDKQSQKVLNKYANLQLIDSIELNGWHTLVYKG